MNKQLEEAKRIMSSAKTVETWNALREVLKADYGQDVISEIDASALIKECVHE